ncbi:RNA-directed RNA polymerase [ssRNA phage SRR7976300_4]|uniref:RNA-directed RNA polymerase n=1 Tax=ssRNA phage SRR7976300_4 TaxID=2786653 RepID=A0A8S5L1V9_9VIRU|nr:RNA-directed RNA polymerase [ssRNA phage SRR7976300_4]DAD51098.1 TPA_asm: RNA-directed RNA polymerase [ssRNA phage SRR7976300_4]
MAFAMDYRFTTTETNDFCFDIARYHACQITDASTRQRVLHDIDCHDVALLCDLSVDYATTSISDSINLRQIAALFSKRADIDLGIDKEHVAWSTFQDTERSCLRTNERFKLLAAGYNTFSPAAHAIFHSASRKIARVLGPVPTFDRLDFRFGPGATTSIKKKNASHKRKLSERCECSEGLVGLLPEILEEVPGWCESLNVAHPDRETYQLPVDIVDARLSFVPKNAKTMRSTVVEPVLNGFVQLGIGDYIARRLKAHSGIDITDQSRNQKAAREGSISNALATFDLSNASDTIARELVSHLLPVDWFLLLDSCRSATVRYKNNQIRLQKFSSMGNGFTFPLETLIFWALASAASEDDPRVLAYGDDLVVPSEYAGAVDAILETAGFTVNRDKSCLSGPFRESCGKDYYSGIDIRPCYLKDRITYLDVFRFHNFYVRNFDFQGAALCLQWLPDEVCIWGPDGFGDGHLLGDHPRIPFKRERGWGGYIFDTYSSRPKRDFSPRPGDRVLPCYSIYLSNGISRESFTPHSPAGYPSATLPGVTGYKRISIYTLA